MTRRALFTTTFGIGSILLAANSCAASPLPNGSTALRDRAAGYEVTVLVDGVPVPTYLHDGDTYLLGQLGARYTLRVANHSERRIEAVVSVDGRDVIDGKPADFRGKRGYLVPAWGSVDIDGWRISHAEAAAFRFSSVSDSYAARTGGAREVGVIGVAVFPERYVPPPIVYPPRRPLALPESSRRYEEGDAQDSLGRGYGVPPAPSAEAPASRSAARSANASDAPLSDDGGGRSAKGASAEAQAPAKRSRPGLGTEYGEAVSSPIYEVAFVRANSSRPAALLGARYNDREGLIAMGIPVDRYDDPCASEADLRLSAEPFPATDRRFAAPPPGWRRACGWR
ncbi:MAG TPA: hypothetical protein VFG23_18325 [Polyangia bacterium]|nr:hypothetical protein [Polyangia bacterium]